MGEKAGATAQPAVPEPPTKITDAEAFIAKCQNRGITDATLKKYKTFTKQLCAMPMRGAMCCWVGSQWRIWNDFMLRGRTTSARGRRSWRG